MEFIKNGGLEILIFVALIVVILLAVVILIRLAAASCGSLQNAVEAEV